MMQPADALVWISGASSGIGRALAETLPWDGARVIGISRRPCPGIEHLACDLADPATWQHVSASFEEALSGFAGRRVAFIQAAGTIEPVGFAGEVDTASYTANVLLNSAAPQVLGHRFLHATRDLDATRYLVTLSSGAARSVYPGWSSYGAGKAAVEQWTRDTGAEQLLRGGVGVLAVAPGVVATDMQALIRRSTERDFPSRGRFAELHREGRLADPRDVARRIWNLIDSGFENGAVVDLRQLSP